MNTEKFLAIINSPEWVWAKNNNIKGAPTMEVMNLMNSIGKWDDIIFKGYKRDLGRCAHVYFYNLIVGNMIYHVEQLNDVINILWSMTKEELIVKEETDKKLKKVYAHECGRLSRKYKVSFQNALKMGHDEKLYKDYQKAIDAAKVKIAKLSEEECASELHELSCGRARVEASLLRFEIPYMKDPYYWDRSDLVDLLQKGKVEAKARYEKLATVSLQDICPQLKNLK